VAGLVYDVRVADQEDIVRAMTAGATVETAGEPAPADPLELPLAADAQFEKACEPAPADPLEPIDTNKRIGLRPGMARRGKARQGAARRGTARHSRHEHDSMHGRMV